MPAELIDADARLARLVAAKARPGAEATKRQAAWEAKLTAREEHKARSLQSMAEGV